MKVSLYDSQKTCINAGDKEGITISKYNIYVIVKGIIDEKVVTYRYKFKQKEGLTESDCEEFEIVYDKKYAQIGAYEIDVFIENGGSVEKIKSYSQKVSPGECDI